MTQTVLNFDRAPESRARRTDPDTSHAAGRAIEDTARRQAAFMLDLVRRFPNRTSAELAICGQWPSEWPLRDRRYIAARRLPELRPLFVVNGDKRTCQITRRTAYTWRAVEADAGSDTPAASSHGVLP